MGKSLPSHRPALLSLRSRCTSCHVKLAGFPPWPRLVGWGHGPLVPACRCRPDRIGGPLPFRYTRGHKYRAPLWLGGIHPDRLRTGGSIKIQSPPCMLRRLWGQNHDQKNLQKSLRESRHLDPSSGSLYQIIGIPNHTKKLDENILLIGGDGNLLHVL